MLLIIVSNNQPNLQYVVIIWKSSPVFCRGHAILRFTVMMNSVIQQTYKDFDVG